MPQLTEKKNKLESIWKIVPIYSYHSSPASARDIAAKGIVKFWRLIRDYEPKPVSSGKNQEQLKQRSQPLLSKYD